jgi:hypothetical protein
VAESADDVEKLAFRWLADDDVQRAADLLGLDKHIIEAEAVRSALPDIERFDRVLDVLQSRRYRALRWLAEYRSTLTSELKSEL